MKHSAGILMDKSETFVVEFVAKSESAEDWRIVLVEQGPWQIPVTDALLRIQDRLYDCVDAVLDGQLAERVPESKGGTITIRLDCHNVPGADLTKFFEAFSQGVFESPDYKKARAACVFARDIKFELIIDAND